MVLGPHIRSTPLSVLGKLNPKVGTTSGLTAWCILLAPHTESQNRRSHVFCVVSSGVSHSLARSLARLLGGLQHTSNLAWRTFINLDSGLPKIVGPVISISVRLTDGGMLKAIAVEIMAPLLQPATRFTRSRKSGKTSSSRSSRMADIKPRMPPPSNDRMKNRFRCSSVPSSGGAFSTMRM